jgi:hypothetical protein
MFRKMSIKCNVVRNIEFRANENVEVEIAIEYTKKWY